MLHQVPCDEGPRDAAVAVGEGVNLGEPVVEPRGDQQGVVGVGLGGVLAVPGEQVVEFRVNVFGWAVLVDAAVGPGRVVGQSLEGAGLKTGVEPLPELVHSAVGGLVRDDDSGGAVVFRSG